jgi:DNA-directed RNA polymerase subunit M/transcription elongation factor TFIIS
MSRELVKKALALYLKSTTNIDIVEKNIYKISLIKKGEPNEGELDEKLYIKRVYQAIEDIKTSKNLKQVVSDIKELKVDWNNDFFKDIRNEQDEQDEFLVTPFHVEEGVVQCKKCKSFRVLSYQKQDRSSDEPMTTYCSCTNCSCQWKYSG